MNIEIGKTYHGLINQLKPYKLHILALVDEDMIVYKYFGRHKKRWFYNVEPVVLLAQRIEMAGDKA